MIKDHIAPLKNNKARKPSVLPFSHSHAIPEITMSSKLVLPQCQENPTHLNHPPPPEKPLRIQICGDLEYLDKLFQNGNKIARPETSAALPAHFDEPCLELVQMAFKLLYGREPDTEVPRDIVPRHQYHLWRYRIGDRILPEPMYVKEISFHVLEYY